MVWVWLLVAVGVVAGVWQAVTLRLPPWLRGRRDPVAAGIGLVLASVSAGLLAELSVLPSHRPVAYALLPLALVNFAWTIFGDWFCLRRLRRSGSGPATQ